MHLTNGRQVKYAGARLGKLGGVDPLEPNVIKIYEEGALNEEECLETLLEEIHHSKLLGRRPELGTPPFNELWREKVEPKTKNLAKRNAQRLVDLYGQDK